MKYLEMNDVLTNEQSGFREGRSCMTNLLSYYSRVFNITQERDGWVDCLYLDLKKAFDKVPHKKLLGKTESTRGLKDKAKEWINDYCI